MEDIGHMTERGINGGGTCNTPILPVDLAQYKTDIKYGKEVLGPSGIPGAYDEKAVDCPFVFYHNNQYYMMHVGFDGKGYQTGLAVSRDLLHWKKEAVIFRRGEQDGWDKGGAAGMWILKENDLHKRPALKKVDGKYWMIYHSYPDAGYEAGPAQIGLAFTEDESLYQWTRLDSPILSWKDGGAWEKAGLYKGCLIEYNGKYYMFYNAKDTEVWKWHEQIGMAVSDNMLEWKRVSEKPLICNTEFSWDSYFCADPCVFKNGSLWGMYYYGYDGEHAQEGIAFSKDLYHWEKMKTPILKYGNEGEIDELHAHKPCVIEKDGNLYHFYCAVREGRESDKAVNADPTREQGAGKTEYRCISVAVNQAQLQNFPK